MYVNVLCLCHGSVFIVMFMSCICSIFIVLLVCVCVCIDRQGGSSEAILNVISYDASVFVCPQFILFITFVLSQIICHTHHTVSLYSER